MADSYKLQAVLVPTETQGPRGAVVKGLLEVEIEAPGTGGFRGSVDVLRTWAPSLSGH